MGTPKALLYDDQDLVAAAVAQSSHGPDDERTALLVAQQGLGGPHPPPRTRGEKQTEDRHVPGRQRLRTGVFGRQTGTQRV